MKLSHPKNLLFLYLFAIALSAVWILTSVATWCPSSKQDTPSFPHVASNAEQMFRSQRTELQLQEQRLAQREERLNRIQTHLRKKYPDDVDFITRLSQDHSPTIYAITPTHTRPVQKAELTRLSHTFLHVPNFHWIVVEDARAKTNLVTRFLKNSGLPFTHLNAETPPEYKLQDEDPNWLKPRGVLQRNKGLEWIRSELDPVKDRGVVYFADDDNTYSLQVFEEMRTTKRASVWPVGLVGKLRYETPILKNGKVHSFFTAWKPERPFAMDMAGFAVNIKLLFEFPEAKFLSRVKRGYLESAFLDQLTSRSELEPKADNCTKILVWHTRTEKADLRNEERFKKLGARGSDPNVEV